MGNSPAKTPRVEKGEDNGELSTKIVLEIDEIERMTMTKRALDEKTEEIKNLVQANSDESRQYISSLHSWVAEEVKKVNKTGEQASAVAIRMIEDATENITKGAATEVTKALDRIVNLVEMRITEMQMQLYHELRAKARHESNNVRDALRSEFCEFQNCIEDLKCEVRDMGECKDALLDEKCEMRDADLRDLKDGLGSVQDGLAVVEDTMNGVGVIRDELKGVQDEFSGVTNEMARVKYATMNLEEVVMREAGIAQDELRGAKDEVRVVRDAQHAQHALIMGELRNLKDELRGVKDEVRIVKDELKVVGDAQHAQHALIMGELRNLKDELRGAKDEVRVGKDELKVVGDAQHALIMGELKDLKDELRGVKDEPTDEMREARNLMCNVRDLEAELINQRELEAELINHEKRRRGSNYPASKHSKRSRKENNTQFNDGLYISSDSSTSDSDSESS